MHALQLMHTHKGARTPFRVNTHSHLNAHTHTHWRLFPSFFLPPSIPGILSAAAPVSTPRKHNTILERPNLLFNSAYSAKPLCFRTNHLFIAAQSLTVSPRFPPESYTSYSKPPTCQKQGEGGWGWVWCALLNSVTQLHLEAATHKLINLSGYQIL